MAKPFDLGSFANFITANGQSNTVTIANNLFVNSTAMSVNGFTFSPSTFTVTTSLNVGANNLFVNSTAATVNGSFYTGGDTTFNAAIIEKVFTITDGAAVDINPSNGTIQLWTLGASRTPTATNFASGESVTLMILDGTAFSVTWTTIGVTWVGGSAPSLDTTLYTVIQLWKVGSVVYGALVGYA